MNPWETLADRQKIVVIYCSWPIPGRQFDWCAYFDGEPGGYAANREDAVFNLLALDEGVAE